MSPSEASILGGFERQQAANAQAAAAAGRSGHFIA